MAFRACIRSVVLGITTDAQRKAIRRFLYKIETLIARVFFPKRWEQKRLQQMNSASTEHRKGRERVMTCGFNEVPFGFLKDNP